MDFSTTPVPIWVSIIFILSFSTVPVFLIANATKKTYDLENNKAGTLIYKRILLFYWSYFALIALVSLTGFFAVNIIPPRIIIYSTLPLFLFYTLFIYKRSWFQVILFRIRLDQLVYIHLFRFVGVFFFLAYFYNAIPKEFAFIGGIGDILTAFLAIPLIIALRKKMPFAKQFAWIWNIIGLLDILCVLTSAIILTLKAIENQEIGVLQFGSFPFSWIPAFAPATIIFIHLLIFKKLTEDKN